MSIFCQCPGKTFSTGSRFRLGKSTPTRGITLTKNIIFMNEYFKQGRSTIDLARPIISFPPSLWIQLVFSQVQYNGTQNHLNGKFPATSSAIGIIFHTIQLSHSNILLLHYPLIQLRNSRTISHTKITKFMGPQNQRQPDTAKTLFERPFIESGE